MCTDPLLEPGQVVLGRSFRTPPKPTTGPSGGRASVPISTPLGDTVVGGDRSGHLVTFAPPDADQVCSVIIPNVLSYPGSVVVVDPSGEVFKATAGTRRAMGQAVIRLDPFGVVEATTDALNPLDLIPTGAVTLESGCRAVIDCIFRPSLGHDYRHQYGASLLHAVLGYIMVVPEKDTVADLVNVFISDDVIYNLAVVLDTIGKRIPPWSYSQIARFLQEADADRARILSEIILRNQPLTAVEVQKALDERVETAQEKRARTESKGERKQRDQSLATAEAFLTGKAITVYVVVPRSHLRTHAVLLRLWIGLLLWRLIHIRSHADHPPLFLLDHAAYLEYLLPLEEAVTLGRRAGVRVWTFWDDISQLRGAYPAGWPALLNGCGAVQVFGSRDYLYATEVAAVLGVAPEELLLLETDEQVVRTAAGILKLKKMDAPIGL